MKNRLFGEHTEVLKYIKKLAAEGINNPEKAGEYLEKIFGMNHYYTMGCGYYDGIDAFKMDEENKELGYQESMKAYEEDMDL